MYNDIIEVSESQNYLNLIKRGIRN